MSLVLLALRRLSIAPNELLRHNPAIDKRFHISRAVAARGHGATPVGHRWTTGTLPVEGMAREGAGGALATRGLRGGCA